VTTVIEHLSNVVHITESRRAAGHAMTYRAGQELLHFTPELVHLADVVGDYLAGDVTKAALMGAFRPFLASVEAAAGEVRGG
jgi:hypothetical protein